MRTCLPYKKRNGDEDVGCNRLIVKHVTQICRVAACYSLVNGVSLKLKAQVWHIFNPD